MSAGARSSSIGLALYGGSFFLMAVGVLRHGAQPCSGYDCAWMALVPAAGGQISSVIRGCSKTGSLTTSACCSAGGSIPFSSSRHCSCFSDHQPARHGSLAIATLAMIPFCWIVFYYHDMYPRRRPRRLDRRHASRPHGSAPSSDPSGRSAESQSLFSRTIGSSNTFVALAFRPRSARPEGRHYTDHLSPDLPTLDAVRRHAARLSYAVSNWTIASCPRRVAQASGVAHGGSSGRFGLAPRRRRNATMRVLPDFAAYPSGVERSSSSRACRSAP